jgi:hypothetical protein
MSLVPLSGHCSSRQGRPRTSTRSGQCRRSVACTGLAAAQPPLRRRRHKSSCWAAVRLTLSKTSSTNVAGTCCEPRAGSERRRQAVPTQGRPTTQVHANWSGYPAGMARLDGSYEVLVVGLRSMGGGGRPDARRPRPAAPGARDLPSRPRPGLRARWHADRASVLLRGGRTYPCSAARTRAGTSSRRSRAGTCCGYAVASTLAIPRAPSSPAASRPRACTA